MRNRGPAFVKGHGTQNDFVILPDTGGELELTAERVRALCDRRRGLGADGVLRVIRTGALPDAPADVPADVWFMDYRNADGSIAEMCGNGVRVFARYLVESGLAEPGELLIGTRAGVRPVRTRPDGRVTVQMGQIKFFGESATSVSGVDFAGVAVDVGNPHLACVGDVDLDALDLTGTPPRDTGLFPDGVNIEFVQPLGGDEVRMRVHERGVGETRSCGTGTVAATAAALRAAGEDTGSRVVHVPGGTVEVEITSAGSTLTGPAVLVGGGQLGAEWWQNP
ncbi:diaminopimelate epimerase [Saccharopolyspora halophila]|uniref:Diaminopimelate epimerase n=1 Tax=Saccharopolyspora halophila TaxID=405551 RepID=A0ABN3FYJ1_9PSEU